MGFILYEHKVPITIVTGFLGSGKTTLLSQLIKDPVHNETVVLVNEFGEAALDHHLLRQVNESTLVLGGGCICCSIREDLVDELKKLLNSKNDSTDPNNQVKRVVIETSGLADPVPIVFTITTDPVLQHHFYVASIITVVDAYNGALHLKLHRESYKQISVADQVVISKIDMVDQETADVMAKQIIRINPTASVEFADSSKVNPNILLQNASLEAVSTVKWDIEQHREEGHINQTESVSLTFDHPIDWTAFGIWLSMLLHARGEDVLRVKGMIDVGEAGPVIINGVQHIIHPPQHLEKWPVQDRSSKLVFITRGVSSADIVHSLEMFQGILGAKARLG